jgi:hypothetical protein
MEVACSKAFNFLYLKKVHCSKSKMNAKRIGITKNLTLSLIKKDAVSNN